MKRQVVNVKQLLQDGHTSEIEASDDEMHITFYHFGPEGQKMETTLIVTDILEEELDP